MESISVIIGRNPQVVEKILGRPGKKTIVKGSPKYYYQNDAIEIVYIHNTADWITIINRENRTIGEFISFFGLMTLKPFLEIRDTKRYQNVAGLKEITFNYANGNIYMVYIQAFTV
jgi:hypothetical protein